MSRERIPLWKSRDQPSLEIFPIGSASPRGAVLVLPGGGYRALADHEGATIAERLNAEGFEAGVLYYRLAPEGRHPDMLHDAQRAMRMMRKHPAIRSPKIAVLGFSAGGHLAASLSVHAERMWNDEDDLAGSVSARPDASVLCYAVLHITGEHYHGGSREALLGGSPEESLLELMDMPRQVDENTPPAFLWHTVEDKAVPVENSLDYAAACRRAGVPFALHVYEKGPHGIGLALNDPEARRWMDDAVLFLGRHLAPTAAGGA